MKIDKLREKQKSAKAKAAERAKTIREKEAALESLKKIQEDAAAAGDLGAYEVFADKVKHAEADLIVYIKSTAAAEIVTPEDAAAAWTEICDKTGGEVSRLYGDYTKARHELATKYEKAVLKQNEMLKARRDLADMAGVPEASFVVKDAIPDESVDFPKNHAMKGPEFAFFSAAGEWKQDGAWNYPALDTINTVVRNMKPVEDPRFNFD